MKFVATKPTKYGGVLYQEGDTFIVASGRDARVAREVFGAKAAPEPRPVSRAATVRPPEPPTVVSAPEPVTEPEALEAKVLATEDAPTVSPRRGGYQTRRLKAED